MERRNLLRGAGGPRAQPVRAERHGVCAATHHKRAKPRSDGTHGVAGNLCRARAARRRSWTRVSSGPPRASPTSSKSSAKKCTPSSTCGSAPTSSTAAATAGSTGGRRTARERASSGRSPATRASRSDLDNDGNATAIVVGGTVLCGRRKHDLRAPGIAALHDGDDRLHGAAAAAHDTGRESRRPKRRSRVRNTATWRRSCRSSSRPSSPRNR